MANRSDADSRDWTPPRGVDSGFGDFSDIETMSPEAFAVNVVGAPAEQVMPSHSLVSGGSFNTPISFSPEDVKMNVRQAISGKKPVEEVDPKDYEPGWSRSLPVATEQRRSTSRGGASTVSWNVVDTEPAEQSSILYPPPGKKT